MKTCGQTETQSVLEHGESVKTHLTQLLDYLEHGKELSADWQLPLWFYAYTDEIKANLPNRQTLELATLLHDCGKPFCLTYDEEGNRHFPNHAQVSHDVFSSLYADPVASYLILHDMDVHLLKAEGVPEFAQSPYAPTQLLIALAELHSNAKMFGGKDSVSFKIKFKSLNSRGNALFKIWK